MMVNGFIFVPAIFGFGFVCLMLAKGPAQPNKPNKARNHRILCAVVAVVILIGMACLG